MDSQFDKKRKSRWVEEDVREPLAKVQEVIPSTPSISASQVAHNVKVAKDALEKARKAELVQKQIQEHLKKINFTKKLLPTTANLGISPMLFDNLGRPLDEFGNVLKQKPVIHSTLKVNRNLMAEKKEPVVKKAAKIAEKAEQAQYTDPTLNLIKKKKRRAFNFAEPGTYIKQERMLQRQMEDRVVGINKAKLSQQKKRILELQSERLNAMHKMNVAEEKGISVDEVTVDDVMEMNPNLIPLKKGITMDKKDSWDEEEPILEWWDRGIIILNDGQDPFKAINAKKHQFIVDIDPNNCIINEKKFTTFIEHPCKIDGKRKKAVQIPQIILTKEERKKLRRRKRQERLKKIQDQIKIGKLPPPPPKLKLSNLMRVLKDQSVADPSKVEKQVREQMEERLRNHEKRNEERKLTPEQRSKKHAKKWQVNKHSEIEAALFTLESLSNSKLLFKVDINAQQYQLTGCCIVIENGPAIIVVEGSKLSIKRYTKLLMRRIKWDEYDVQSEHSKFQRIGGNFCKHIWVGSIKKRNFPHWSVSFVECEMEITDVLKQFKATHYYEMVKKYRDPLEDV